MKVNDMRFDELLIGGLVGKNFDKYMCDPFDYTNSVTQIACLCIEKEFYSITNIQEYVEYYGMMESISVFKMKKVMMDNVKSAFKNTEMISTPIEGVIKRITLINENQKVSISGDVYNVWLTRGIIFEVDGREISFEKDIVPFSEEIIIRRGYELAKTYSGEEEFLNGWQNDVKAECYRESVVLTSGGGIEHFETRLF